MTAVSEVVTFGEIDDDRLPLAVLVHGFPDTPWTWRHLGPQLADSGYRVVAPWLPGYATAASGPVSVGTYVRHILDVYREYRGDGRALLVGHDWGASAGYGAVTTNPGAFERFVALAVPPAAAFGSAMLSYPQLKRSFYVWFIQQAGLAENVFLGDGFWESLWADWSPGYDATADIAELRRHITADTIAGILSPYRATFNPTHADPAATAEATATFGNPPIRTLYLHGHSDGAVGAELLTNVEAQLPAAGSQFAVVDGVGHFLHLEDPAGIWGRIKAWLAD